MKVLANIRMRKGLRVSVRVVILLLMLKGKKSINRCHVIVVLFSMKKLLFFGKTCPKKKACTRYTIEDLCCNKKDLQKCLNFGYCVTRPITKTKFKSFLKKGISPSPESSRTFQGVAEQFSNNSFRLRLKDWIGLN